MFIKLRRPTLCEIALHPKLDNVRFVEASYFHVFIEIVCIYTFASPKSLAFTPLYFKY